MASKHNGPDDIELRQPKRCGSCGMKFNRWQKDAPTCLACRIDQDHAQREQRYLRESDVSNPFGTITSKTGSKPR